eukprot:2710561-Rhodomonas_salina.1
MPIILTLSSYRLSSYALAEQRPVLRERMVLPGAHATAAIRRKVLALLLVVLYYASAMRCPVLAWRAGQKPFFAVLRQVARYAMSGTGIGHAAIVLCDVRHWHRPCFGTAGMVLGVYYAMCGTDRGYAATSVGCLSFRVSPYYSPRFCYAASGTDIAYGYSSALSPYARAGTDLAYSVLAVSPRSCYAVSRTETASGTVGAPLLPYGRARRSAVRAHPISLRSSYALSGTDMAYGEICCTCTVLCLICDVRYLRTRCPVLTYNLSHYYQPRRCVKRSASTTSARGGRGTAVCRSLALNGAGVVQNGALDAAELKMALRMAVGVDVSVTDAISLIRLVVVPVVVGVRSSVLVSSSMGQRRLVVVQEGVWVRYLVPGTDIPYGGTRSVDVDGDEQAICYQVDYKEFEQLCQVPYATTLNPIPNFRVWLDLARSG